MILIVGFFPNSSGFSILVRGLFRSFDISISHVVRICIIERVVNNAFVAGERGGEGGREGGIDLKHGKGGGEEGGRESQGKWRERVNEFTE